MDMANLAAALEAAVGRITKREIKGALQQLKADVARLQRAIERQGHRAAKALGGGAGRPPSRPAAGMPLAADEVKALRTRLGLTQAEFARLTGVTHVAVYFWESGRTSARGRNLAKLREVERMTPEQAHSRLGLSEKTGGRTGRRGPRPTARRKKAGRAKKRASATKGAGGRKPARRKKSARA